MSQESNLAVPEPNMPGTDLQLKELWQVILQRRRRRGGYCPRTRHGGDLQFHPNVSLQGVSRSPHLACGLTIVFTAVAFGIVLAPEADADGPTDGEWGPVLDWGLKANKPLRRPRAGILRQEALLSLG